MNKVSYLTAQNPESPAPSALAAHALKEHRVALGDNLNYILGQPSMAMAMLQEAFDGHTAPQETVAHASACDGLLAPAVARRPFAL